ncbi:ligand-binding sensor domain-containing protein [Acanthopleuribacter pedis]|uniref:Histidine kinase domain-containing protein n=1 Tax=Acanthopleuribacter pedis TaxID=442870 RepID=A0A8J7Q7J1_9BACT|nr:two-component regulator propeller domain-containing protein [Acanthopleuribacter pedis]MBO1322147.1 hypothetical protein [Acanthopleuribacter pedis]
MTPLWLLTLLLLNPDTTPIFTNLGSNDGLSQSTVWASLQDDLGFVWIATTEGLNRYDGHTFKVFKHDPNNPNSLADNQIRDLCLGNDDDFWMATANGLSRYIPKQNRFETYRNQQGEPDSLSYNYTVCLAKSDDSLWIGTREGLNRMRFDQPGRFQRFRHDPQDPMSLNHNEVRGILFDRQKRLWVATFGGLAQFDPERQAFIRYPAGPGGLSHNQVRALAEDSEGFIWAGTSNGLNRFNPETQSWLHFYEKPNDNNSLHDDWINVIVADRESGLWIGTKDGGLHLYDSSTGDFTHYSRTPGLENTIAGNNIISLFIDRARMLWIGTYSAGVSKLDLKATQIRKIELTDNSIEAKEVQAMYLGRDETLWVGTQYGLIEHNQREQRTELHYHDPKRANSLSENQVLSIQADLQGRIWAGTYSGGLNRYLGYDRFKHYRHNPKNSTSLASDIVLCLMLDKGGDLWLGTREGLSRYQASSDDFWHWTIPDGEQISRRQRAVITIHETKDGTLWLGTDGAGLIRYSPRGGDFTRFRQNLHNPNTLHSDVVNAVYEDGAGVIWLGTNAGLTRFEPGSSLFTTAGNTEGLPSGTVYAIIEGESKALWLSTNQGIFRYVPESGAHETRHFDVSDGLQSNDFFRGAVLKDPGGNLYFGGINGVNVFHPANLRYNEYEPPVVLTSFRIFDEPAPIPGDVAYLDAYKLSYKQNMLSFEFAALDYSAPRKNQYAYMLEGFDSEWIYSGSRNYAAYSNLDGGTYRLRIKGANNHGKWNEAGLSLQLTVTPPFWRTTWFLTLIIVLLVVAAIGSQRYWVSTMNKRNDRLQDLVETKTFELEQAKQKLLETAHQAGIFEIATGVLRQIKGQLESVKNEIKTIQTANMKDNIAEIGFLAGESRHIANGETHTTPPEQLVDNIHQFQTRLQNNRIEVAHAVQRLIEKVEGMKDTIAVQHQYATKPLYHQDVNLVALVEDALRLESARVSSLGVEIHKNFDVRSEVRLPKIKLLHVLSQVIRNSLDALEVGDAAILRMRIAIDQATEDTLRITLEDNGCGIEQENLERVFTAGWTTKTDRHGFGLHESVNAMREMHGELTIESPGKNRGTKVTLILPF